MILEALKLQAKIFLTNDMDIKINSVDITEAQEEELLLKEYTSMVGIGGTLNGMVIISYDKGMLEHFVELFLEGEEVDEEEFLEVLYSTAGEIVNTIIGLSLPTFPNRGKGVTITPPIAINDASNIKNYKNSIIKIVTFSTEYGVMSVSSVVSSKN